MRVNPSIVKNVVVNKCFERAFTALGLPPPQPEYRFHPTRRWKFDYAFLAQRVAVEVEGGIWRRGGGAHSHPSNIKRDLEKYNAATLLGWAVLRYPPERLLAAIPEIATFLVARASAPFFSPAPNGEHKPPAGIVTSA